MSTESSPNNNNSKKVMFNGNHHDNDDADSEPEASRIHLEPLFSKDSAQNMSVKEARANKKVRRVHSSSFSHSGPNGHSSTTGVIVDIEALTPSLNKGMHISAARVPYGKNSKKSRSGLKGLPKKGGAGGKGIWGKPGSELDGFELDENDPDYDSDAFTPVKLEKIEPVMNQKQFDENFTNWLNEYFEHGDPDEILANLEELNGVSKLRHRIPYLCISLAIQKKPLQCELTSELLSQLSCQVMDSDSMQQGFALILKELSDLQLDTPEAPDFVGRFIARAVADDVLPPKFVQSYKGQLECPAALKTLAKAENLLTMAHAFARLDTVWGVRSGIKATKMLVRKIRLLLREFLVSDDKEEAMRCLRELEAPHFHHELVYQAVLLVIEKSSDDACSRITRLLSYLCDSAMVTVDQLQQGLRRIFTDMSDIQLDVPAAYILLERFIDKGQSHKFISDKLAAEIPSKGRKRFVSEGDGGRFKNSPMVLP